MTRTPHSLPGPLANAPDAWQVELQPQLAPGERVVATLETDLDMRLAFFRGLVVLTNHRLLARSPGRGDWEAWPFMPGLSMLHHDHAGVGTLELHDATSRLACWRFTLAHNVAALRLNDRFAEQLTAQLSGQPVAHKDELTCPTCKAPLPPDQEECPICSRELHEAPSTWTLFRLWRFARPYRGQLLAGFSEQTNKGVDIGGRLGDPVYAAAPGRVMYTGTGIRGYGKLIVIKHENGFNSVYAHNKTILVKEGQTVTRGQRIAELGETDASKPALHFEIRKSGKPVDPLKYLPTEKPPS